MNDRMVQCDRHTYIQSRSLQPLHSRKHNQWNSRLDP
jgi:hypothetical protein